MKPIVTVVTFTPDPEALIATAARTCYASAAARPNSDSVLIKSMINRGHESVLEHASITFHIECSRVVSHELVRHRIAAYSQRSQRFVKENRAQYLTPPEIKNIDELETYDNVMQTAWAAYGHFLEKGIKPQIARYVLPNACMTTLIATWNLREIRHIINLRIMPDVQPEMREVASIILDKASEIAPNVFADMLAEYGMSN